MFLLLCLCINFSHLKKLTFWHKESTLLRNDGINVNWNADIGSHVKGKALERAVRIINCVTFHKWDFS